MIWFGLVENVIKSITGDSRHEWRVVHHIGVLWILEIGPLRYVIFVNGTQMLTFYAHFVPNQFMLQLLEN